MALLDIDRHILMEIANCLNSIKNSVISYDKATVAANVEFQIIRENLSKTEALISHLVSYVKEIDTQKGQETKEN